MGDLLVVDGYNVIFADPHLAGIARSYSLQEAREGLVQYCEREESVKWHRIVIVFDGRKGVRSPVPGAGQGGVEVQFARTSADAVIEKLVHDVRQDASLEVTVVTNDRMIRQMVRGNGAFPITVAEFLSPGQGPGASRERSTRYAREQGEENRLGDILPKDVVEKITRLASGDGAESDGDVSSKQ